MRPQFHRLDLYEPKTLEAVSQAFDAIWNVLREDDPFSGGCRGWRVENCYWAKAYNLGGRRRN